MESRRAKETGSNGESAESSNGDGAPSVRVCRQTRGAQQKRSGYQGTGAAPVCLWFCTSNCTTLEEVLCPETGNQVKGSGHKVRTFSKSGGPALAPASPGGHYTCSASQSDIPPPCQHCDRERVWPLENEKCLEMQSTHPVTQLECPRHSGGAERGIRRNQVPLSSKHVESREVTSSSVTGLCNL